MNDDAAHREEHIGEHLQNAVLNGTDRRFSLRSPQARFCFLPHTRTCKPPLRFSVSISVLGLRPLDRHEITSRQVQIVPASRGKPDGPDAADKGLSGFEISPGPLRPGIKGMSGRLRPAAHGTNIELRRTDRHQDIVHWYIQQGAPGIEVVHRRQALATLPLVDGLGLFKTEELLEIPDGQTFRLPQPADVGPGSGKVDDRERIKTHNDRLHSDSSVE